MAMHFFPSDESSIWFVEKGGVSLFIGSHDDTHELPFCRIERNNVFMTSGQAQNILWIAKADINSRIYKLPISYVKEMNKNELFQLGEALDVWIRQTTKQIDIPALFREYQILKPNTQQQIQKDEAIALEKGVQWLKIHSGATFPINESDFIIRNDSPVFPIDDELWFIIEQDCDIETISTKHYLLHEGFSNSINFFMKFIVRCFLQKNENNQLLDSIKIHDRLSEHKTFINYAIGDLLTSFSLKETDFTPTIVMKDNLWKCLQALCELKKLKLVTPSHMNVGQPVEARFKQLMHLSKIYYRPIALEGSWESKQHGAIFALTTSGQPLALMYKKGHYHTYNVKSHQFERISPDLKKKIQANAFEIYRQFPAKKLNLKDLMLFSLSEDKKILAYVLAVSFFMGLLGLATPIFTQKLFDDIVPYSEMGLLAQVVLSLFCILFATGVFQITRAYAALRLETKMTYLSQIGVWERLLKLPVTFFRQYSSGDILDRASGIGQLRQMLSGATLSVILSSLFSITSLIVMFSYHAILALIALSFVIVVSIVIYKLGRMNLKYVRQVAELNGRFNGVITEYIRSIIKIRCTASESKILYRWAQKYSQIRRITFKGALLNIVITVTNSVITLASSLLIFSSVYYFKQHDEFSLGVFLAFNTAYGQLLGGITGMVNEVVRLLNAVPLYERAKPIIQQIPECHEGMVLPKNIRGKIELSHISFRYDEKSPLILQDINLNIEPGEHVAIVGPSGSGKSTLLRLLLNFNSPTKGKIFYDGVDSEQIDMDAYRTNIGVVLQNDQLIPASIYENICGSDSIPAKQVWDILEMVNLAKDIEDMPMQLNTMVGFTGGGLSGGQAQRLMIARALIKNPKLLILDEATSALDNISQKLLINAIDRMRITRIVIAHRLSTIVSVDKIVVVEEGQIKEQGTYEELLLNDGVFTKLVQSQLSS